MNSTAWRVASWRASMSGTRRHGPLVALAAASLVSLSLVAGAGVAQAATAPQITKVTLSKSVMPPKGGTTTVWVHVLDAQTCSFSGMTGVTVPSGSQNCSHGTAKVTARIAPSDSPTQTHLQVVISANGGGTVVTADAYLVQNPFPPLKITNGSLLGGGVGKRYKQHVHAQGGRAPYKWQLASGTLPIGMKFWPSGALSGIPTVAGSYPLTIQVTDSSKPTALTVSATFTLEVAPAPLKITTKSLPGGATLSAYDTTLAAVGGTPPYTWKWISGELPPGVTLATTGDLSGTPTGGGTYPFTVEVTDSAPSPQTAIAHFHVTITTTPLKITTMALPGATLNSAYTANLGASGGVPPYTWSLDSGQLPSGITLASSGALAGTATVPGIYRFKVKVNDSSPTPQQTTASFKLFVAAIPLAITTNSLPGGTVGSSYSESFAASGGTSPYYWTVASGALPNGITLSTAGALSGTPTAPGTSKFTVKVTDSSPKPVSTTAAFKLAIAPVSLLVANTALPAATSGSPYTASLLTSGGTAPFTWQKISGTLPAGINLSSAGNLAGITKEQGTYTFTVRVTDSSPVRESARATLTMIVGNGPTSWSGYIKTGKFSSVNGTFTVPSTVSYAQGQTGPPALAAVSEWVGLDGVTGSSALQAGVTEIFSTTPTPNVSISPWWSTSTDPTAQKPIVMTVSGGDSITVDIFRISGDAWAITLDDNTSKQDFRTETTYSGPAASAEWVVAAPGAGSGAACTGMSVYCLASYSPSVNFTVVQSTGSTKATAAVVLVQAGVQVSTPSTYTTQGFAVAYGSVAPPAP